MSLAELQAFKASYKDSYFGQSDKDFVKLMLDALIEVLVLLDARGDELDMKIDGTDAAIDALDAKIDALEVRVAALE